MTRPGTASEPCARARTGGKANAVAPAVIPRKLRRDCVVNAWPPFGPVPFVVSLPVAAAIFDTPLPQRYQVSAILQLRRFAERPTQPSSNRNLTPDLDHLSLGKLKKSLTCSALR